MKRGKTIAVACASAALGVAAVQGAEQAGDVRGGPPFPRIANCYGTWLNPDSVYVSGVPFTTKEVARTDLLIGVGWPWHNKDARAPFKERLAELKQHNPHLIALSFTCSAPYTDIAPPAGWRETRKPGELSPWLPQTDGSAIAGWPGTYMINLARPEVVEFLALQSVPPIRDRGYDGTFIDCMAPVFDSWACEIATGKPYTVDADEDGKEDPREALDHLWRQAKARLSGRVRELIGDGPVFMANQAGEDCFGDLNGIYLEDYVDGVLDGHRTFESVLQEYLHWTRTPHRPTVTTLGCSSGIMTPYDMWRRPKQEQLDWMEKGRTRLQRMRFGLAMTLMGDGYYSYDMNTRWRGQHWWYPEYDAPLGYPTGEARREPDGVWRRSFDGGSVAVNPTPWDVRIALAELHRDVSTDQVDSSFLVPSMDGRIFIPTSEAARPGRWPDPQPPLTREGPPGIAERDGRIVLRAPGGLAAQLAADGALTGLWRGELRLLSSVRTVIVADERWRDFEAQAVTHAVSADGSLSFSGRRTDGEQALDFVLTVRAAGPALELEYRWKAATPLQLHAFRQAVYLPPETFAGGRAIAEGMSVALPAEMANTPGLAEGAVELAFRTPSGQGMRVTLPRPGSLIDDRHYNGPGYLFCAYPVGGQVAAGSEWNYRVVIAAEAE